MIYALTTPIEIAGKGSHGARSQGREARHEAYQAARVPLHGWRGSDAGAPPERLRGLHLPPRGYFAL